MTKGPCKFRLLQGACSSLLFAGLPCSCPVVYRVTGAVPCAFAHPTSHCDLTGRKHGASSREKIMTTRPHGRPPFRADHIGSLLRPAALRQAFRRHAEREIGDEEFARIQDDCIRAVI